MNKRNKYLAIAGMACTAAGLQGCGKSGVREDVRWN